MKIHSVQFLHSVSLPGKVDKQHHALSMLAPIDPLLSVSTTTRYHIDTDNLGVKLWDKDKQKSVFIPWPNVLYIKMMEEENAKKVDSKST